MELRVKVKPRYVWKIKNKNSFSLHSKLRGNYLRNSDGTYSNWGSQSQDEVLALVFEKHRKKINITKKRNKGVGTGKAGNSFKREVVSGSHWMVSCYVFNKHFLKDSGLKIIQHSRHFDIIPAKK